MNNVVPAREANAAVRIAVRDFVSSAPEKIVVVSAAPGAGKSTALLSLANELLALPGVQRVAIAAQTNNQADDLGVKYAKSFGNSKVFRFASSLTKKPENYAGHWVTSIRDIEEERDCVLIATAAKWGQAVANAPDFRVDYVLVDEAFQMTWSTFVQVSCLGPNFVLIGDAGQIPPVVPVEASRWDTSNFPPHWPAPETVRAISDVLGADRFMERKLEFCWRLPQASIAYIVPFYDRFDLQVKAVAGVDDRELKFANQVADQSALGGAIELFADGEPILITVPDEIDGDPIDADVKVSNQIREFLRSLLAANPSYSLKDATDSQGEQKLKFSDIAICSTKRAMNALIENTIQDVLNEYREDRVAAGQESVPNFGLKVDTPERLQGLEFKVFLAVHPLSNARKPNSFDLETGRLCVMASRHLIALAMFSRAHVLKTLNIEMPNSTQAPGLADAAGLGHRLHKQFIDSLSANKRVIETN
jgi:hypothetical protein